jgi:hypothetical protein
MTTIIDGTAGITFPNSTVQASAGQVLQVVNATYATMVISSSSTFADTGLTATITPKFATSKILVIVNQAGCVKETNSTSMNLVLLRGSTQISNFARLAGLTSTSTQNSFGSCSTCYLDSPATTSATTYKTQFLSSSNSAQVVVQVSGGGVASESTITLMEIAA